MADFGLILPTVRETTVLTGARSAYGSHFYAAPEQATDFHNVSEGADIFALGCILHDNVCPLPSRVPFAQIRFGGPYSAILEKCTEFDVRNRFPSIASFRAALFDLWQIAELESSFAENGDLLDAVLGNPFSVEAWRALILHVEGLVGWERGQMLRRVNAELIRHLRDLDDTLFSRMMDLICEWAAGTGFDWDYCDVVGDRLLEAYGISPVRIRAQVVLAALKLAVSHNRWHVMHQIGTMLGQDSNSGLVDRIMIELDLDPTIEPRLRRVEEVIRLSRDRWHPRLAVYLNEHDRGVEADSFDSVQ